MPLSSGIMVFEVRGGLISGYFRSKFGISLGRHFGYHLDLIFTSFWSYFVRFWKNKNVPGRGRKSHRFWKRFGIGFELKIAFFGGKVWQFLEVRRQGRGRSRENSPNSPRVCKTILTRPSGDGRILRLRPCCRPPVRFRLLAEWEASGSTWDVFRGLLFPCGNDLEVCWVHLGSHCAHIGCHWAALGGRVVTFGPLGLYLGRSWKLFGLILMSFGVTLGAFGI